VAFRIWSLKEGPRAFVSVSGSTAAGGEDDIMFGR
jgi:hypothetical protein